MVLNIEKIDVTMSSSEESKLTSKMLYHQKLDLKKKIHFNRFHDKSEKVWKARLYYHSLYDMNTIKRSRVGIIIRRKKLKDNVCNDIPRLKVSNPFDYDNSVRFEVIVVTF